MPSLSATYTFQYLTTVDYSGVYTGQYSDPVTLTATLTNNYDSLAISGKTITFYLCTSTANYPPAAADIIWQGSDTTDATGTTTKSLNLDYPSGTYTVFTVFAGDTPYLSSYDSHTFTIAKETATIEYTGDTFVYSLPGETSAPVRLSATVTQDDDGYPGDLTKATVIFSVNLGGRILLVRAPVNEFGEALAIVDLPTSEDDVYEITVRIEGNNKYWISDVDPNVIMVYPGSNVAKVTGGGWIQDSASINDKGNFGFTVEYNKKSAPKGNFVYIWRGDDGFNYKVKSNSWQGGGLWFTASDSKTKLIDGAYFTGKCTFTKIDRITGEETTMGNCAATITIYDGDLGTAQNPDGFAITIFDGKTVLRQVGTPQTLIELGGGNIVVHK